MSAKRNSGGDIGFKARRKEIFDLLVAGILRAESVMSRSAEEISDFSEKALEVPAPTRLNDPTG